MNIYTHPILAVVWVASIAVNLVVCFVCFKGPRNRYPFFGICLAFSSSVSLSLIACSAMRLGQQYSTIYWVADPVRCVLVMIQALLCFRLIFGPYRVMPREFFWKFGASALALTGMIAVAFAVLPSTRSYSDAPMFTLLRSCTFWLCGMWWLISIFADHYRLPLTTRPYGIALGYMVRYTVSVVLAMAYSHTTSFRPGGRAVTPMFTVQLLCDLTVSLIWARYFFHPELRPVELTEEDVPQLQALAERLNRQAGELRRSVRQGEK